MNQNDNFDLYWRDKLMSKAPGVVMIVLGFVAAFLAFCLLIAGLGGDLMGWLVIAFIISAIIVIAGAYKIREVNEHNEYVMDEYKKVLAKSKRKDVHTQSLSAADEIMKFKQLLDNGIITQEEFDIKKKQLLGI